MNICYGLNFGHSQGKERSVVSGDGGGQIGPHGKGETRVLFGGTGACVGF